MVFPSVFLFFRRFKAHSPGEETDMTSVRGGGLEVIKINHSATAQSISKRYFQRERDRLLLAFSGNLYYQ